MVDVLGTRLGRYEIRERLGRGGMATVYKAWDANLDRWVAVKVLHDHLADDPDFKQRFEREAKLVAALNHPNIVQIFDFDVVERDGEPIYYMVMAFINGPSLRQVMEQHLGGGALLPIEQVDQVMSSVCGALAYAHKQGMIHRDVTPSNILFNEEGGIVLADFGLARLASGTRLTQTGMTTGTPVYMSPEQGMGDAGDARSDLYSLGVILYEMLAGEAPYSGDSAFAIIMKHVNDPVPLVHLQERGVNPALEAVIVRSLAKEPDDRYQSAPQMLSDFKRATMGQMPTEVHASPGTLVLPTAYKKKRNERLPFYLVGIGLIVLLGIGLAVAVRPVLAPDRAAQVTLAILPTKTQPMANSMTEGSTPFSDDFSTASHSAWMVDLNDGVDRKFEDKVLRIRNPLPAFASTTVINPSSGDYAHPTVIESNMTIAKNSQPPSGTGIIFRYQSDDDYYVFAFDGLGRVSIWIRKDGQWTELRGLPNDEKWTVDEAVGKLGEKNRLKLIVNGRELRGFINDKQVISVQADPLITSGGVGVYLATTTNPNESSPLAQVDVANYSVQDFVPEATPIPTKSAF